MMTIDQFITKYLGKQVEYHSYNPNAKYQCVDLANAYIKEVLGLTPIIGTDAKDIGTKASKTEFDWIPNTPTGVPQPGDIMIWNSKVGGGAGHIAVFLDGDANSFTSLDQNLSKPLYVTKEKHNYTNILGWLHPKKGNMSTLLPYLGVKDETEAKAKLKEHLGEKDGKSNWGATGDSGGHLGAERKKNAELLGTIKVREKEIDFLDDEIKSREKEILRLSKEVDKQGVVITQLETEIKELKQTIKDIQNAPTEELGALQLITLTFKAIISGKW